MNCDRETGIKPLGFKMVLFIENVLHSTTSNIFPEYIVGFSFLIPSVANVAL
jgi:hypothetical protein